MLKAFFSRLLIAVACLACLAGCGEGDSETRGDIVLPDPSARELSAGLYLVEGEASFIDPERGGVAGFEITITKTVKTPDGQLIFETSDKLRTNSFGVVQYDLEVEQGAVESIVTIAASSGGHAQRAWVTIPALAPIATNPVP